MRKNIYSLFFLSFMLVSLSSQAQTIFSEDFNGANPFNNWTLIDNDTLTPDANVAYVTDAWVVREDFDTTGVGDSVAVSTSWYSPAGTADDYMITPMIITTANPILEFDAKAQDPAFPDGYEVRISTTTPDIAGLLANPPLFSVASENGSWTRRSLNLSAYANDTIYIAWRNNSSDQFLLLIDNIKVFEPAAADAGIVNLINPIGGTCFFSNTDTVFVDIQNFGSDTLTTIPVAFRINGGALQTDTFVGSILPGATSSFIFGNTAVNLTTPGVYVFELFTDLPGDGDRSNDTLLTGIFNTLTSIPYTDDFDSLPFPTTGTFANGWSVQTTGNFLWLTNSGPTTSTATGPTGDHTSGTGVYFYTEASSPATPGEVTALTSPCLDLSTSPTAFSMEFWYHMYGADIQTLFIQVETLNGWVNADSLVGQQQFANTDAYLSKIVDLTSYTTGRSELRVRFITVRGNSFDGDIAIDDVRFVPAALGVQDVENRDERLTIYPNPTDLGFVNVEFSMEENAKVSARIHDISGRIVESLELGQLSQGVQRIRLNTDGLENGIYFVNLTIGNEEIIRKVSVMK